MKAALTLAILLCVILGAQGIVRGSDPICDLSCDEEQAKEKDERIMCCGTVYTVRLRTDREPSPYCKKVIEEWKHFGCGFITGGVCSECHDYLRTTKVACDP